VARRLKALPNPPIIVFGGANCEGEMGLQLLRSFPWIDYVCTREGDVVFPEFVDRILRMGARRGARGLLRQGHDDQASVPALVSTLDDLPIPDYAEYVARLTKSPLAATIRPSLLIETSRGCWWGAKHHCVFCGLNGETMAFRSKSSARVLSEMATLSATYGIK